MSSQVAGSRNKTGDPSDPWLMASAPRLNWAWASSHESADVLGASVGPSSCWASRHSWGVPVMGCEGVAVGPDEMTIGDFWKMSDDGRCVSDALGRVSRPEPPNIFSTAGTGNGDTARRARTLAAW